MTKASVKIKSKKFSTTKRVVKRRLTAEGWKREMVKNKTETEKRKQLRSK